MRVVISAGGTGGHIYPALAIINKIKDIEPNSSFLYIGTTDRMEKDIIPELGIPYVGIEMKGINRKKILDNVKVLLMYRKAIKKAKEEIKKFKPDVVLGVGGYITAPVIIAAHKAGYKTVIHEQNSIPGVSNKHLEKYVDKIFYLECVYLTIVILIIVALGNKYNNFSLDKEVIIALITTTTINVIGLFVIVAKYLFPQK